jgi:hypothetical protein
MESQTRPLFYMLVGIGGLLVVIAVVVYFRMRRSASGSSLKATGVVVDLEEDESEGNTTYTPIVKFTAHDGTEVTFTDAISSDPPLFKVGEEVKVRYDSANFHNARITGTFRAHMVSIVLLLTGGVLMTIGLVALRD